jgi:hypothetical protein
MFPELDEAPSHHAVSYADPSGSVRHWRGIPGLDPLLWEKAPNFRRRTWADDYT